MMYRENHGCYCCHKKQVRILSKCRSVVFQQQVYYLTLRLEQLTTLKFLRNVAEGHLRLNHYVCYENHMLHKRTFSGENSGIFFSIFMAGVSCSTYSALMN